MILLFGFMVFRSTVVPRKGLSGNNWGMSVQPPKKRMTEIGDESRTRILDAAETLFLEKGYDRTTLVDVGKLAGISYGSIPWHFQNKQGLLFAVAERAWESAKSIEPLTPGIHGLNRIIAQQTQWENHRLTPVLNLLYQLEIDFDAEWHKWGVELDFDRHQEIIQWIHATMGDRAIAGGVTPESLAYYISSAGRGIGAKLAQFGPFPDSVFPREALRQSVILLMGLEE
jgi:TetR/AcrR family acrAB operon transcriptional repressor